MIFKNGQLKNTVKDDHTGWYPCFMKQKGCCKLSMQGIVNGTANAAARAMVEANPMKNAKCKMGTPGIHKV